MQRMTCRAVVGVVPCRLFVLATFATLLLSTAPIARAQSDDFNDGNDTGWTRYSPLAGVGAGGTFSFPSGGYRIQAPASPNRALAGPGRAGSFLTGNSYTQFAVTVDLVNWNNALDQAFGILARTTSLGLGTTNGYALTYATDGPSIDISRVTGEAATTIGSTTVTLDPAKDYRLIFEGVGASLTGRVYDLANLGSPVGVVTASDGTYAQGVNGVFVFDNSAAGADAPADATFDNFFAGTAIPEPSSAAALVLLLGAAGVVRRRRR
jgi:hypothetical protein